jgi:hypothetical protein
MGPSGVYFTGEGVVASVRIVTERVFLARCWRDESQRKYITADQLVGILNSGKMEEGIEEYILIEEKPTDEDYNNSKAD